MLWPRFRVSWWKHKKYGQTQSFFSKSYHIWTTVNSGILLLNQNMIPLFFKATLQTCILLYPTINQIIIEMHSIRIHNLFSFPSWKSPSYLLLRLVSLNNTKSCKKKKSTSMDGYQNETLSKLSLVNLHITQRCFDANEMHLHCWCTLLH